MDWMSRLPRQGEGRVRFVWTRGSTQAITGTENDRIKKE